MKKLYLLLLVLFSVYSVNAQIINFPDANFKMKLIFASPASMTAKDLNGNYFHIDANNNSEIEISEALNVSSLSLTDNLVNVFVRNLTGIQYFTNLSYLSCDNQSITSLDVSGMVNLKEIQCTYNQMTNLNLTGVTNLETLNCNFNQLSELNINGLNNLKKLKCSANRLSNLNVSTLSQLEILECGSNPLNILNVSNLSHLRQLHCFSCSLTALNVTNCPSLTELLCYQNSLTGIDFSGTTNIENLDAHLNQFQTLNVLTLRNLNHLNCARSNLSSLDVNGLQNLVSINCTYNRIESINLNNCRNLGGLECQNNLLLALDISSNFNLSVVNCSNNALNILNIKNGLANYTNFASNNYLQYICTDKDEEESVQGQLQTLGYTNCNVNTYCSFVPGGEFYTIHGAVKSDANNDGCDVTDMPVPSLKFKISDVNGMQNYISNTSGNFTIPVQAGTYTISPGLENLDYFSITPASMVIEFPMQSSPFQQNFCLTAVGVHPDLEIIILPIGPARPGFDANYKLVYKNKGNVVQSGSVALRFNDAVLDLVTSNPTATAIPNNLSWNFTNLVPFETREISFTMNVNSVLDTPAVNLGDQLYFAAVISSIAVDEVPNDNTFGLKQVVVNSFDPNDKTCLEGSTIAPSEVGKYVHYMIRFENTGTFPAENIVVKDMIDTNKFDINSLVPIKGSHSFVTNITSGNKVEFIFENINLPFDDANNDGYVAFKIKTKPTLVVGNTFSNSASIYFDYNFPIVTNMATTTIQTLSNQDFSFGTYFSLYPNPVNDVLNIESKQTIAVSSVSIYNQLGQLMLVVPNAQNVSKVDVSNLASGNYFIKINSDKGTSNTRFIKQ